MVCRMLLHVCFNAVVLLCSFAAFADSTFVKFGASWKYLDDGTNPGTAWKELNADATTAWTTGVGEFGYGKGSERTNLGYGANAGDKYPTTYFRKAFSIPDISLYSSFNINLYLDDGAVIFVNGREVSRINMPAGALSYKSLALGDFHDNGNVISRVNVPTSAFTNGANVIAVEVHQGAAASDDLTFDLELAGLTGSQLPAIIRGPMLQMVSADAITIKWKTSLPTTSSIRYGLSEDALNRSINDKGETTDHELRITGLQSDKKYYYAVGTTDYVMEGSYRNYFMTAPPANTTRKIRIGVFGDNGSGSSIQRSVRDGYLRLFKKEETPEIALLLGDNAYGTGTDKEYQRNFFDFFDDNVLDNHSIFAIPGNHEYYSPGVPYFSVFSLPANGESGGVPSGTESYYSFNYGNIHFIMLNSMGFDKGKPLYDSTGQQAVWMKKDLAANAGTHKWTIVCLHHPPYTNGSHNSDSEADLIAIRQQITPILERYGVDAVLAGHSHVYERSFLIQGHSGSSSSFKAEPAPNGNLASSSNGRYDGSQNSCPYFMIDTVAKQGTVYVVAGSAGQVGGGNNDQLPVFYYKNYSGSSGGESGVLYLEVQDNRLDAKFVGMSGIVRDQFTIMKGVNTKKTITVEAKSTVELTASWVGAYNWLPAPPAGKDGMKTLSVTPTTIGKVTYYVRDSIGASKTCISDTFVIQTYAGVLPANTTYNVIQKNNKVILKWKVAQDANTDYYTVARSANGRDFEMLTIIKSSPGLTGSAYYEFEDNYPLPGKNYYRLTQTAKSGQTLLLGVRDLAFEPRQNFSFSVKSIDESNIIKLDVTSFKKQLLGIKLLDMNGQCIYQSTLEAFEGRYKKEIRAKPGAYVLSIAAYDGHPLTERIMVR
jgi:hypothetical protein